MTARAPGRVLWGEPGHSEMVTAQRECQGQEGPGAFLEMPLGHLLGHRARMTLHISSPSRGQDSSLHSAHGLHSARGGGSANWCSPACPQPATSDSREVGPGLGEIA